MSGGGATFSRGGALALIAIGMGLLLALLYLIGAGEQFGGDNANGQAHAASNGLNGYAGLVRLVEAGGYLVERSRNRSGLATDGLLVLAPTAFTEAEEVAKILKERTYRGPTLVILPKWFAFPPQMMVPPEAREKFKRGWVVLGDAEAVEWTADLPAPYTLQHKAITLAPKTRGRWSGLDLTGTLPTSETLYADKSPAYAPVIIDEGGRALALRLAADRSPLRRATPTTDGYEADILTVEAQPLIVVAEPDLLNNYGLADRARAAAAIALVNELTGDGDIDAVTFDMTLNGYGASENLLTLAFRPPFLAATLCLIVALLIIGWRAFQRFGPPAAANGPDIAFGKRQLITNGAGLILRARRFALLAQPYAALSTRRIGERLGLMRPDPQAIDAALARRLPGEEPFTRRAARLEAATGPAEILAAARGLDDLATKLQQGQETP
jgi:hypothetical protein